MIDELHVQDVALIEDARLTFAEGLTVLTGETGAGKSALLSSLKLLQGERSDAGAVREGAAALRVEGRFYTGPADVDGTIVRRRVEAQGRGKVEIDGQIVSVRELAEGVGTSIDLCGQHEHQKLLDVTTHQLILDEWIGEPAANALASYQEALAEAAQAKAELDRIEEMARAADAEVDQAAFILQRIDAVSPKEGEFEELEELLPVAEHAEQLIRAAEFSRMTIMEDEGVVDRLYSASNELDSASRHDAKLEPIAEALHSATIELEDVAESLRKYQDSVDFDEQSLLRMQNRMSDLQGLMRAYGPRMQEVFEARERASEQVSAARDGGKAVAKAKEALEEKERELALRAKALDEIRSAAAPKLCKLISEQMQKLEMGTAELDFEVQELDRSHWTRQGSSRYEFSYRPAHGMGARPLKKIASGGEVSRVMLACKVILSKDDAFETLVFDEVDAGVGGATAKALAEVLKELSKKTQVIVVTHLPQVAIMGDRHFVVEKVGQDTPVSTIHEVAGEERVAEIARMLSGDSSKSSLEHARDLLAHATA